jgi:non-canonical purine NTP pyrophosphatase (RdgB/HAM1 family)
LLVYVATKNAGKLDELRAIFAGSAIELTTYGCYGDVEEGTVSFQDNALLKARTLREQLRRDGIRAAVIADDSGIAVEALGGRPGVLSARYAGENATWSERRRKLLEELRGVPEERRTARFICYMPLILDDGRTWMGEGFVEGRIAREERGSQGFGYDPIFIPNGETQTFAEMSRKKKNSMSHRHAAALALLEIVRALEAGRSPS